MNYKKIILYTTHCPKCLVLEKKLTMAKIDFTVSEDISSLIELGFRAAPILYVDGEYYEFADAVKLVNSVILSMSEEKEQDEYKY